MRFRYNVKYESFGGRAIGRMVQMQNESKSRKTEKYFDLYWYIYRLIDKTIRIVKKGGGAISRMV